VPACAPSTHTHTTKTYRQYLIQIYNTLFDIVYCVRDRKNTSPFLPWYRKRRLKGEQQLYLRLRSESDGLVTSSVFFTAHFVCGYLGWDIFGGKAWVACILYYIWTSYDFIVQSTARHAIHLQFFISANALEIRAVQSPKCIVWCAEDCTYTYKKVHRNQEYRRVNKPQINNIVDELFKHKLKVNATAH
jgi:hypothetical protein